jgi:beta-galactosidase
MDAEGRKVPVSDNEINFQIVGEGRIIGLDNGNPVSHEDFHSNKRKLFNGLCLAILQTTGKHGSITLTAHAPGLKSGSVKIEVLP